MAVSRGQTATSNAAPPRPDAPGPPPLLGRGGPPGAQFGRKIERAKNARGTVRRLWGYLDRQRGTLIAASLMVLATIGLDLMGPFLLGRAIDGYLVPRRLDGLGRIGALLMTVYAASALLNWLQNYLMAGAAERTVRDLRADLFEKLQHLELRFFDQHAHGDLMSRLTNDVENVNQVLSSGVTSIVSGLFGMVGVAAVMLTMNVRLALVSLTTISLLTFVVNRWMARRTRPAFQKQQAALGRLNGLIEETITGQRVVKAYHREPVALAEFDAANGELRQEATRAQSIAGIMGPFMNTIGNTGLAVVAGVGGAMAARGLATVGIIVSFINYTRQFGRPLNDIANLYNTLQSALAGAERVFEVIDETPETDAPDAVPLPQIRGEVIFEDVHFAYKPESPVLKGISLHALPGQVVALIGPTGAGKTTIINLLTRFYEIDAGRISIDGQDIRSLRKEDLRRQIGIVLQDTFLFAASVRDNIRYGRLDATDAEVVAAAKLANADQFIHRLPQGYDTLLSERGRNLSQGQRQMLAIARAVLTDPRILILDEATSSVDTRTEKHIQEAMRRLMAGRTSFVIAHRLSTIRDADQILVLTHGEILERGTHQELLAQHGFYYRLNNPSLPQSHIAEETSMSVQTSS
jgi:ATP-binding cassette subfamily B multidrug efflux pump